MDTENVPPMSLSGTPLLSQGMDAHPKKSGAVYMTQSMAGRSRKVRVILSVYSNSYDSYVVVSQDKLLCKDSGYINLRNCTVQKDNNTLQIVPQNGEGQTLSFTVSDCKELDSWLQTLRAIEEAINNPEPGEGQVKRVKRRPLGQLPQRCPSIRRKPVLPALTEECSSEE